MRLEVLSDTALRQLEPARLMALITHVQRFIDKGSHTSGASSRSQSLSASPGGGRCLRSRHAGPQHGHVPRRRPAGRPPSQDHRRTACGSWRAGLRGHLPTRPKPSPAPTSATRHGASWSRPLRAKGPTPPASEPRPRRSQPETRPPNSASCASTPTGSCGSTTTATEWCALRGHSTPTAGPGSKPRSPPSPTGCGARTSNSPRARAAVPNNETSTPCARPHPSPGVRVQPRPVHRRTSPLPPRPIKTLTARRLHPSPGVRPPVAPVTPDAHPRSASATPEHRHWPAVADPSPGGEFSSASGTPNPPPGSGDIEPHPAQELRRPRSTPRPKGANLREQH